MGKRSRKVDGPTWAESKFVIGFAATGLLYFLILTFYAYCFLQRPFLRQVETPVRVFSVTIGVIVASLATVVLASKYLRRRHWSKGQKKSRG